MSKPNKHAEYYEAAEKLKHNLLKSLAEYINETDDTNTAIEVLRKIINES